MKQISFLAFIIFLVAACTGEQAASDQANTSDQTANQEQATNPAGTTETVAAQPKSKEEGYLLKNFWVFEFYLIPDDQAKSVEKRGTWYAFSPDGTFEMGHWENTTTSGKWYIYTEDSRTKVRCDAADDTLDAEWELQFNQDGDVASWIGTSVYETNKGVMGKVINLLTKPTKKQFGYE